MRERWSRKTRLGDSETGGAEIRDLYADLDEDELTQTSQDGEGEEP